MTSTNTLGLEVEPDIVAETPGRFAMPSIWPSQKIELFEPGHSTDMNALGSVRPALLIQHDIVRLFVRSRAIGDVT